MIMSSLLLLFSVPPLIVLMWKVQYRDKERGKRIGQWKRQEINRVERREGERERERGGDIEIEGERGKEG